MKNFKNKVVVITGAGSGIGRGLAIEFAKLNAKLAINDKNEGTLLETVNLLPEGTAVYQEAFDVSNKESMYAFAEKVNQKYGQVDVVINNAGVAIGKLMTEEVSIEEYEWIVGINLWGVMYGSLAFMPYLRKQQEASLVNISSVFGFSGIPFQTAYCTTKFAVRGFTESLILEEKLGNSNLTVSCVHPGGIQTNIARSALKAGKDLESVAQFEKTFITPPDEAARTIINGIRKKKTKILIGHDAVLFDWLTKMPKFFSRKFIEYQFRKVL